MGFYVVVNSRFSDNGFAFGEEYNAIYGQAVKCELCGSFLTGLEWLPPLMVKLAPGKLGDVIYGTYDHFLVSEKFKNIYEENNFRGIETFEPVVLYRKGMRLSATYFYPRVTLSSVHFDLKKSGVLFEGIQYCGACQKAGRVVRKMGGISMLGEDTIIEDVFCTKMLPGTVIVSKKFAEAVSGLLNLSLVKAEIYVPNWLI